MRLRDVAIMSVILFILLAAAGCSTSTDPTQLTNPAAVYCSEQGGEYEIRKDADGNAVGYCKFDDGSECDAWAFFRGDCSPGDFPASTQLANPAAVYCLEQGGEHEIREHEDGSQFGVCIFDDGSECDAWDYFRGDCAPGDE